MTTRDGIIKIRPVLFCAPVFWTSEFWSESTHDWDWVSAETPLGKKPWAEDEVSLDVTLPRFEHRPEPEGTERGEVMV